MSADALGVRMAAEIAEQPAIWEALAAAPAATQLRDAIGAGPVLFLGSGSSLFVAELAAREARRCGIPAFAVAATDVEQNPPPFAPAVVVAFSQSGRSVDVLAALDAFGAVPSVALTNEPASPLARRAQRTIDVLAGSERAVPATKSVTAMAALVRLALAADEAPARAALRAAAASLAIWLAGDAASELAPIAELAAAASSIVIAGSGDGVPAAREVALKFKESTYRHAEGVAAGEFRHGGIALFDATRLLIVLSGASEDRQVKLVVAARAAGATAVTFGAPLPALLRAGPVLPEAYSVLGWIVTGQMLALILGRALGINVDMPRGIAKVVA